MSDIVEPRHRACSCSTRRSPASGTCSGTRSRHLILPASLLGYLSLAYISRMTRSFMLDELAQEYIIDRPRQGPVASGG